MSIVVDASVLVAAVTDAGETGAWAVDALSESQPIAPVLVLVESMNILRRLERARSLDSSDATAAQRDLMQLDVELLPFEPFAARVWALRRNLSSCDAWYVAVAETFDTSLAALDRRLARSTGPVCRFRLPG
ncbi:MAG: type II toxin-antitoxin system VapC family toxin [Deltaproteobacteria bacterium]|nr:type II toxin-antitoxin system VapC family toxin [Deltaproteobacteria bacterium]